MFSVINTSQGSSTPIIRNGIRACNKVRKEEVARKKELQEETELREGKGSCRLIVREKRLFSRRKPPRQASLTG